MTVNKTAEDDLRDSLSMYEDLLSNIPVGVCRFRMKAGGGWQFDFVNSRFCELIGLNREDVLNNYETVLRLIHSDDLPEFISLIESVEKTLAPFTWEGRLIRHGETRWTRVESSPTQMDNGDVVWTGHITNITDRKKAEESLEKSIVALTGPLDQANCIEFDELFNIEDIQRLQDQFAQAAGVASIITHTDGKPITRASNFCRLCRDIIRRTDKGLANIHMSDSVIGRYHPEGPVVRPCLSGGLWDAGASITVNGRHIANWLVGQVRNEAQSEEKIREYAREIGVDEENAVKAFYEVPTMPQKQFEAVTQSLFTLANLLSTVAYHNVQQARLIVELKQRQEDLRESDQRSRAIFDNAAVGIDTLDRHGKITAVNPALSNMLSYTEDELKRLTFEEITHPDDRQISKQNLETLMAGHVDSYRLEKRYLKKDGEIVWGDLSTSSIKDAKGNHTGTVGVISEITERKRIEDALRESEERFRKLVQNAPDAIYVQTQHCFAYLNPMALKLFGAETPYQLLGQPVIDRFDPRRHDTVKERIRLINEERRSVNMLEEIYLRLDGAPFHVEVSAVPLKWGEHHGALVFFRDITKRLELEERLRHNQIMLARTERIAQIGSWEWEVATDSVTWSDELFRIFQLDPTRGVPSFEEHSRIYTPDSLAGLREAVGLALSDSIPYEMELQGIRSDGEIRHHRARGFPERGPDGRVDYIFGSLEDMTDRKRLEEERLEMQHKLLQAQKLESLAVMAAGIAHDFNNHLAVVLGNLELALADQTLDPETLVCIESAVGAAKRSAELSRQMQVYTGNIMYFPVDIDLNELLNRDPALLKSTVSKYVDLNFETNSTLPIFKGDAEQLQRLVMNILVNASEAIADKDGNVTIRTGFINCDSAYLRRSRLEEKPAPGRFVFLEVTDTGCGMDVMTQHKLFDPFFSTKFTGRGLGMAEVIGIVKSHRGAIIVESEVEKGTTVRVLFPALEKAQASSVHVMDLVKTKASGLETVNRRKTILLVEDEAGVRNLVVRRLDLLGYDSIIAEDGEEGVRVFRERMNEIDLVMLDYKMPKMNGVEAFGELIRIKPDVKVILSSGYTEDVVLESFPGQRPAFVLLKPYKTEELKAQLDRLLGTEN